MLRVLLGAQVRQMQWCLVESRREQLRKVGKQAVCISISQDKRGTRQLVRFRCSSLDLKVTDTIMALIREVGTPEFNGAGLGVASNGQEV